MSQTQPVSSDEKRIGRPAKLIDPEKLTLRVPGDALDVVRALSALEGLSNNDLILKAIDRYFETHPARALIVEAVRRLRESQSAPAAPAKKPRKQ